MVEVTHLRKVYGDLVAVDDLGFHAPAGAIFGLLGPNGAGKSTTIDCIAGLTAPTAGQIRVAGFDVVREGTSARSRIGVVPQELALYEDLSVVGNLKFWGAAYGLRGPQLAGRVDEILAATGLDLRADEPVERLSGGFKRRLNLGCGLVHAPSVLLLDEPTSGVDPQSRARLLDVIRERAHQGACVVYTTHYLDEAQDLCDRIAILERGRLLVEGTLEELRELAGERDVVRMSGAFDPDATRSALAVLGDVELIACDRTLLHLGVHDGSRALPRLIGALERARAVIHQTTLTQASLETLFIKLTGRESDA